MRKHVSRVKDMLESQGYSPQTTKEILELFNSPKGEKTKAPRQTNQ